MALYMRDTRPAQKSTPRLIGLIGPDGVGKSTFVQQFIESVNAEGGKAQRVWLRFPHVVSIPILVYCRLAGLSYFFEREGVRYGVWEMWRSRWITRLFPWFQLIDTALSLILKVHIPLRLGRTIVCDRFVHDVLVDTMIGIGDDQLHERLVGQLFLRLVPGRAEVVCIDAPAEVTFERRPELKHDAPWQTRRALYRQLSEAVGIPIVDNSRSIQVTKKELQKLLGRQTMNDSV
jgi:thymidylate kinase